MNMYKPRIISLTKKPNQTFGFYLRVEHCEKGHLIRCLEMGGPAELAGMKDGDRIVRVNGTFVDELSHSEVVEMVRNGGTSVTFHILDESSYKQAKEQGVNLSDPQRKPVANGAAKEAPKAKLCYLVKSSSSFGFSLRSVRDKQGLFMTEVIPGSVADKAGIRVEDRLLEVNGENVENSTHDQVVEKIKLAGNSVMFLLVDEETEKFYQSKHATVGAWLATVKHLPLKPRVINVTKGPDGYGFLLRKEPNQTGHIINDIDRGSPAERAGLQEKDRIVAVDGTEVETCSHEQVVDRIKQSGNGCCLLVVDKHTDQMYKQGSVSPMLFWIENESNSPPSSLSSSKSLLTSPPSYSEVMNISAFVQPSKPMKEGDEDLKPKLCKMEKTSAGFGFHLNGIQGVCGQYIKEVVKDGAADKAGMEDDDIVVEVNQVNVEKRSHGEVVEMIRESGDSLEMLVASKNVYEQLKAQGVAITRQLLGETSSGHVHTTDTGETTYKEKPKEARPLTPTKPEKKRTASMRDFEEDNNRFALI
ncbi:Na(+)/H(+) exchange regulatory cofactor NHE-RF3 [Xenentodon cancila]